MIKILAGLFALGIVVIVHELGHFFAARVSGVTVETFSVGWGPVLLRKKLGETEYRLSLLPIGGYCGMKGEHAYAEAIEKNLDAVPREERAYFSVHPLRRIFIAFSGPAANLVFAVVILAIVSAAGSTYQSYDNRIVPASAYESTGQLPVDKAGLLEGDRIVSLGGKKVSYFSDIQEYVGTHPDERISVNFERDGKSLSTTVVPALDKKTGAGRIGIYPYVPLAIGAVKAGSAAETADLRKGDVIVAVNGKPVAHYIQFSTLLEGKPEQVHVTVNRGGMKLEKTLVLLYDKTGTAEAGLTWQTISVTVRGTGFLDSVKNGFAETGRTFALTVKSIGLLFRGVDLTEAVSGPVRITMLLGEVAQSSLVGVAQLLSIICVSLFLMNLLPIPILDGGLILFSVIELLLRRQVKPKTLYYVQFIGIAFIAFLFIFALFGDIRYLMR